MIRVSGPKPNEIIEIINGKEIDGVVYTYTGKTTGIQAYFATNAADEGVAKDALKKYMKQNVPHLRLYFEVV